VVAALAPLKTEDFEEVAKLWRESDGVGLRADETPEWLASYLTRNPEMSWTAREDGRVVGALLCGHDGRRGYLYHLAVAENQRRSGTGRALVGAALESLAKHGISRASVFIYDDNAAALDFWRAIGWHDRVDLRLLQKGLT
jgi:N-acetylglutamate synthase